MPCKTSCFNPTLFKKNLTRFWPMWALYGLFWFLCMPATMFRQMRYTPANSYDQLITSLAARVGIGVAFLFSVLCAMALFSYLFQHRSAVAMHAFPLRREYLFLTNYVSGLAFFVIPLAINFVLTLLVEVMAGWVNVGALLMWFTAQLCYALFFFSFAVFCAMFTGNLLALPAFYGILSFLPVALAFLIDQVMQLFVFGYYTSYTLGQVAETLSPLVKLCGEVSAQVRDLSNETLYYISGWGWILLYALVGVLLAVAALLVYRRRHVESAGDVVSVRVVRPLFLYGVSTCMALAFGLFLFALFGDEDSTAAAWQLLAFMVISGFLGYFAARMLLHKTLRVWRGYWKGFVAFSAALALVVVGMEFDLFGFERAVPQAENVVSVQINGSFPPYNDQDGYFYTQPEGIQQVIDLNQTIVDQRNSLQQELNAYYNGYVIEPAPSDDASAYYRITSLYLSYTMQNGSTFTRYYHLLLREQDLDDPNSLESQLQALLNQSDLQENFFGSNTKESLSYVDFYENQWGDTSATFTDNEAALLFQAVLDDLDAGRIGQVWLLEGRDYEATHLDITINFTFRTMTADGRYQYPSYYISLTRNSTSTLAALQQLGVIEENFNGE